LWVDSVKFWVAHPDKEKFRESPFIRRGIKIYRSHVTIYHTINS